MRDSNYRSVTNNRAAVTITTSLYDRRALDVTSDKPLVNSLNHLTYLVSSSAKVRETLSNDGGVERLVEILHECHISMHNVHDSIFNGEKKLLTAWKWTLAFQCLVLIGTRGTEKIRQKVVRAGMLPVIATVLDNYISLHEGTFFGASGCAPSALSQVCSHVHIHHDPSHNHSHSQQHQHNNPQETNQNPNINIFNNSEEDFSPVSFGNNGQLTENRIRSRVASASMTRDNQTIDVSSQAASASQARPNMLFSNYQATTSNGSTRKMPPAYLSGGRIDPLTTKDYEMLSVDQLFKLIRESFGMAIGENHSCQPPRSSVNNDIRRRCLIMSILNKLKQKKECEVIYHCNMDECEYDMDNNLQFLSNLYLQDDKTTNITNAIHSKIAPRNFTETGTIIPRDDDVVWCLQLLAYISKYPYLKEVLQNTHILIGMSIRDKKLHLQSKEVVKSRCRTQNKISTREALVPRSRTGRDFSPATLPADSTASNSQDDNSVDRFNLSTSNSPELSNLNIRNDNLDLVDDKLDLYNEAENHPSDGDTQESHPHELRGFDDDCDHKYEDKGMEEYHSHLKDNMGDPSQRSSHLNRLFEAIINAESIADDLDRELALFRLSDKVNDCIEEECRNLTTKIIEKRLEEKKYLSDVWNYDNYDKFDIDDVDMATENDYDVSLMEYKKVNLFPMVEKFTFLAGTDMYYWSGVIMRNSCRRNDFKGGVRQCGNLECGKWEKTPREFSKCKRCKRTKYCSRDCQMRAWHCHKNWCVPSSSSNSTNTTDTTNTAYDGQHDRTMNMGTTPSDSEAIISNTGDLSQHISTSDQETQYSEL
ncbi:hypothetical protein JCM33374_g154 [Metschnikowia sp. JCM 33374]|nr:hypothetical protein JCM33374_g154 [Metschnikowia sp. JCM 33374]